MEMKILKKVHLLHVLLVFLTTLTTCISQNTTNTTYCGKIRVQHQFFSHPNSTKLAILNHMLLCKAQKLYYRTTLGLFQVSSIDYDSKLLTVSHSFWSSTSQFISPTVLSAGLPHPSQPNSLVLLNCSSPKTNIPSATFIKNCTSLLHQSEVTKGSSTCLVIEDAQKLGSDFHPREMSCTHYSRMYRKAVTSADESINNNNLGFELGTRISFDIPDHVPDPCEECKKPNGNCGAGLRCICHPIQCKDKVISSGVSLNPFGHMLFSFLCFITIALHFFSSS